MTNTKDEISQIRQSYQLNQLSRQYKLKGQFLGSVQECIQMSKIIQNGLEDNNNLEKLSVDELIHLFNDVTDTTILFECRNENLIHVIRNTIHDKLIKLCSNNVLRLVKTADGQFNVLYPNDTFVTDRYILYSIYRKWCRLSQYQWTPPRFPSLRNITGFKHPKRELYVEMFISHLSTELVHGVRRYRVSPRFSLECFVTQSGNTTIEQFNIIDDNTGKIKPCKLHFTLEKDSTDRSLQLSFMNKNCQLVPFYVSRNSMIHYVKRKAALTRLKLNRLFIQQLENWRESLWKPPYGALVEKTWKQIEKLQK